MHKVTLIPGDGIGPEVAKATREVIDAAGADIDWDLKQAGQKAVEEYGTPLPDKVLDSIRVNRVALKGPITTPIGVGFRSVNVALRKELDLYANVRPVKSLPGVESRFENIDITVVRENTEDLYAGVEYMVGEDVAQSIKIFTKKGCERIIRYAFDYAKNEGKKRVTSVHKANIMKCTDGMFKRTAEEISAHYPEIEYDEVLVDAMCMKLVQNPEEYEVLVLPNLYGDIVSDLCAGLVGGLGVVPGANIGHNYALFEPVHGSAPDIAGQNLANPAAMMLSGVIMLKYLGEVNAASRLENAVREALVGDRVTPDLGGEATTEEFTGAVIAALE